MFLVSLTSLIILAAATILVRFLVLSAPVHYVLRGSVQIPAGASAAKVGFMLTEQGIIRSPAVFTNAVRARLGSRKLRPGKYLLLNIRCAGDLADQLLGLRNRYIRIIIPEGIRREQTARFFAAKYPIDTALFDSLTGSSAFAGALGVPEATLEGYLFPDGYRLPNGSDESAIIRRMVALTQWALDKSQKEEPGVPGWEYLDVLTLASIIEGEVRVGTERSLISAVYHNRLKKGMRLEADPTVQFALPGEPRRLLFQDYRYKSNYNTYLHKGLPPGPINSPGIASIRAALNPGDVEYLFFVAQDDGHHIFADTYAEHKKNIAALRQ